MKDDGCFIGRVLIFIGVIIIMSVLISPIQDEQAAQAHKIEILERAIAEADAEAKEAYFQKWSKLHKEAEEKTGIKTTLSE